MSEIQDIGPMRGVCYRMKQAVYNLNFILSNSNTELKETVIEQNRMILIFFHWVQ